MTADVLVMLDAVTAEIAGPSVAAGVVKFSGNCLSNHAATCWATNSYPFDPRWVASTSE
jgi:hypothetical protein